MIRVRFVEEDRGRRIVTNGKLYIERARQRLTRRAAIVALTCFGFSLTGILGCRPSTHDGGSSDGAPPNGSSSPITSASAPATSTSPPPPLIAAPTASAPDAGTAEAPDVRTPAQIRKFVADELRQINGMPPKCMPHMLGLHASHIEALGKRVAPYLVERLTDTTLVVPGPCDGDRIRDYAEEILDALYDCEGPHDLPCTVDGYCARSVCLERPGQACSPPSKLGAVRCSRWRVILRVAA